MNKPKASDIKTAIERVAQDIITNESAILGAISTEENKYKLINYNKIELGGDTVGFCSLESSNYQELNNALITSSAENRKAVWNFITKALT